jgi:hypothetical protein
LNRIVLEGLDNHLDVVGRTQIALTPLEQRTDNLA